MITYFGRLKKEDRRLMIERQTSNNNEAGNIEILSFKVLKPVLPECQKS